MNMINVGAACLNQTPLDWVGNFERISASIAEAKKQNIEVFCLPELAISGYGCEDCFQSLWIHEESLAVLKKIVPLTQNMIVAVGLPMIHGSSMFNTVALLVNGRIEGVVAKQNLASEGLHYETRWFKPWPAGKAASINIDGQEVPFGDHVFSVGGLRIGFEICEDAWVANRPGVRKADLSLDLIMNPSASHFAFGKSVIRERLITEGSRIFNSGYIYANLLGNESGRVIYDGDVFVASLGEVLTRGPQFSYSDFKVSSAQIDLDKIRQKKLQTHDEWQSVETQTVQCIQVEFPFENKVKAIDSKPLAQRVFKSKEEEFTRAVALGLMDYLRKSHSNGFVVSLSGGADSAAVVSLIFAMVKLADQEFGFEALAHRLNGKKAKTMTDLMRSLLTCVYQSTENSSDTTLKAAQGLAESIDATFFHFEVGTLVSNYEDMVSEALGRKLDWGKDDIALQNIQARVRAPGVWMLANINNALLLSTSNRSEAAVGYATMDGDTCGGLSPIAGIDKAFLRSWLRWMEVGSCDSLESMPALHAVNVQTPTAELRPSKDSQTDEEDLMPYDILDAIEKLAIRDKRSPQGCLDSLKAQFPSFNPDQHQFFVTRFFKLWSRNQWKRERYAPSFHLDDENLDPKTWCRFPILSAGFEYELSRIQ